MAKADAGGSTATTKRIAVVTGSNKGVGYGICKLLAGRGVMVVLTARDEKKGLEAVEKLKEEGVNTDLVHCHPLDLANPSTISALADFVKSQFGRLDILVNNAGVSGVIVDWDALKSSESRLRGINRWNGITTQTYEMAEECIQTNYYGAKRMVEAFIPLLQLSKSPRIVNVSSAMGQLRYLNNEWAKGVLRDVESLTEEKIEEVLKVFLKDFREGELESRGWPAYWSAYIASKAALNAYTRILANRYPRFRINCVYPGFVKTDMTANVGSVSIEEAAEGPVKLALLPDDGPTGLYFDMTEASTYE